MLSRRRFAHQQEFSIAGSVFPMQRVSDGKRLAVVKRFVFLITSFCQAPHH